LINITHIDITSAINIIAPQLKQLTSFLINPLIVVIRLLFADPFRVNYSNFSHIASGNNPATELTTTILELIVFSIVPNLTGRRLKWLSTFRMIKSAFPIKSPILNATFFAVFHALLY
jgi:hypothetical protein